MHPSHEPLPGAWSAPPGARPEPPPGAPSTPPAGASPSPADAPSGLPGDAGSGPPPGGCPPSGHPAAGGYPPAGDHPPGGGYPPAAGYPPPAGYPEAFPGDWAGPPYGAGGPGRWSPRRWAMQGRRRPWRRTLTVAVAVVAVISALGVPFGLLWSWLAPGVPVVDIGDGVVVNDPSPEQYIAADGWFTLLGLGFGLLVAIVAWLALRRDRGPFLLLAVVLGTSLAAQRVAPFVGEMIGRDAYDQWRATAAQGATYLAPPEVHSFGPTLVPAFAAAIVLTLLAGWANDPDLDEPGAHPGYAANHPDHAGYHPDHPGYHPDHPGAYPGHPASYGGAQPYDPADYQRPPTPQTDDDPIVIGGGDHIEPDDPSRRPHP